MAMKNIKDKFTLKVDMVEETGVYLLSEISMVVTVDEVKCFDFSYNKYVTAAVNNVEDNLDKNNAQITSKWNNTIQIGYCPELDVNEEFKYDGMQYHQYFIGLLRWDV